MDATTIYLLLGVLGLALAMLGLFWGFGAWCASRETARGASDLALVRERLERAQRDLAESQERVAEVLERERRRSQGASEDVARAAEREADRAAAGTDDALAERVLRRLDPEGAPPAGSQAGQGGPAEGLGV